MLLLVKVYSRERMSMPPTEKEIASKNFKKQGSNYFDDLVTPKKKFKLYNEIFCRIKMYPSLLLLIIICQTNCPIKLKKLFCKLYSGQFTNSTTSPYILRAYMKKYRKELCDLERFVPASGNELYQTFQDFFIRKLKNPLVVTAENIWPCDGVLCEYGQINQLPTVKVKNQVRELRTIFSEAGKLIPDQYFFSNIFLHNIDYHRIHAPISGEIVSIEHLPGDILILRPNLYPNKPSYPALLNERVIITLKNTKTDELVFITIVGGAAISTIKLEPNIKIGNRINIGEELGHFEIGSTVCMAHPLPGVNVHIGMPIRVGNAY